MSEMEGWEGRYQLVGPFQTWRVVVDGREVPYLTATPANRGRVQLSLDERYAIELDLATAESVVPFLADAIAVGMGYTCHQRPDMEMPVRRPEFPRLTGIDEVA
jgi:hypothetical protein